jgi:integrase/recombinase XerD
MDINVILLQGFEKWLKTLEYAPSTIYASVRYVSDFFFYLKSLEVTALEQIENASITAYYSHLKTRPSKKHAGALSQNYITSNINAIKRFSKYLQITGKGNLEITLQTPVNKETHKTILMLQEVKALYQACGSDYLAIRDRAILGIYYGCGLRRSEGAALDVKDILLKERLVYVRSGKGYKERYGPMTVCVMDDMEAYIYQARERIQSFKDVKNEALFLSMQVKRMCGNALIGRVQHLASAAKINKAIGLHTLRHSIATHLLQSGLSLEEVSQFLGHASLESTQIYTHLAHE